MTLEREIKVTFQPSGRSVFVLPGTILLEASARAGFIVETPCGGAGKCGKCLVRVVSGNCSTCDEDKVLLGDDKVAKGYRLACRCTVEESLTVEIPESSLFQSKDRILSDDTGEEMDVQPRVVQREVEVGEPGEDGAESDLETLTNALGDVEIDILALRHLSAALRETESHLDVTIVDDRVIRVEPHESAGKCCGVAFDIGTTTIVGTLIDLSTGADMAVASAMNPQTSYGDDVLSRIKKCRDDAEGLDLLHGAVLETINKIVGEVVEQGEIASDDICEAVVAGNTTMQQIFAGISPSALGELPFVPAFTDSLTLRATDIDLTINPAASVHVFPQIGGFVGGDTVAGIVATRLDRSEKPALLIDVGTNGELVLAHEGKLTATSVAAGPAFEGARIVNGMRASSGAIEKVVTDGDIRVNVIGNAKAAGICGTGLVDAAAAMLRLGVLEPTGRILPEDEWPSDVPDPIRARAASRDGENHFILVHAEESASGEPLCLYQKDIRELQLANGAIRAGTNILLKNAGLEAESLGSVLLAGAFGNFIRRRNALRMGMLPQIAHSLIRFVGNTASFGAKKVLLSVAEKEYAERITRETTHIDLSRSPDFQMEFAEAMLFPEEEIT